MYVNPNYKTKKAFKEAVKADEYVAIFNPGPFGSVPNDGVVCVEGPHYPEPHKWYASVTLKNGEIIRIK